MTPHLYLAPRNEWSYTCNHHICLHSLAWTKFPLPLPLPVPGYLSSERCCGPWLENRPPQGASRVVWSHDGPIKLPHCDVYRDRCYYFSGQSSNNLRCSLNTHQPQRPAAICKTLGNATVMVKENQHKNDHSYFLGSGRHLKPVVR